MLDNLYKVPLEVIKLCDVTSEGQLGNIKPSSQIRIYGLDRKAYLISEYAYNYHTGFTVDSMISVSRPRTIGDVAPVTIGTLSPWTIFEFIRIEDTDQE